MSIPMVPFSGRMSYCLVKSLQMALAYQGHDYPLPWLEVVSGQAFGFVYVRDEKGFFAAVGDLYHIAGEHLLRTLNYSYTYTSALDDEAGLAALREALKQGPVAVGMLDMGYLTYMPFHQSLLGADHAIVILDLQPEAVIVHDPAGYVAVSLPLTDFLEAWKRDIYTDKPYGLWQIGRQGTPPTDEEIWETTITRARANLTHPNITVPDGRQLLYGPEGMHALANDLQAWPDIPLGGLPDFSWQVSAQRCLDSAFFLKEKLPEAAALRWEECQLYGRLQHASSINQRALLPDLLLRLADYEARFIATLS